MKTTKIVYYITTGIISAMMLFSAFAYITQDEMEKAFQHLGFPAYFRIELAVAKIVGVALLWAPVQRSVRELAYVGFTFTFISAFIAHICSGDPMAVSIAPVVLQVILVISYVTYLKLQRIK